MFPTSGQQPCRLRLQRLRRLVSENGPRLSQSGRSQNHGSYQPMRGAKIDKDGTHRHLSHPTEILDLNHLFPSYHHEALLHPENGQDLQNSPHQNPPPQVSENAPCTSRSHTHLRRRSRNEVAEPIFEESASPRSANHLVLSYSHRRAGSRPDNIDVGKRMESTKRVVLYYPDKMVLSLTNSGFKT